ncbi:beta-1,6-N-acetylglucosaminyltransferase [uncultured Pedobacter sp.]|uniref:beta-1,6-N-acetylglucosaminyltransferase n=1 Tax=uncultured Pedobacter sp. TaxID=246139 RepID=UPI0025CC2D7E|nr:beta-1,6-N-acetylglucosaminyltransferase [uncultured Pedobacter sp.]
MRIAYLILAHQNTSQLATLIDLLSYETPNYCFIHLDGRLHISSITKELKKLTRSTSWHIIKKKTVISWGGFSMVEATLNLILEALNHSEKYDYLSLHSGMDLPIKTTEEISGYLESGKEAQYLEFFKLPDQSWAGNGGLDRVNYYWLAEQIGDAEADLLVFAQKQAKIIREFPKGIGEIYGGSQWWTLTADCAEYIIHYLNRTAGIIQFFKYTLIPDEIFFNTILLNSPFKEKIINDNLRMIDWNVIPGKPKVFDSTDKKRLNRTKKFFARKFDEGIDKEIITYFIDKLQKP